MTGVSAKTFHAHPLTLRPSPSRERGTRLGPPGPSLT